MIGNQMNQDFNQNTYENNSVVSKVLGRTFMWMFVGLVVSALVSWYTYVSGFYLTVFSMGWIGLIVIGAVSVMLSLALRASMTNNMSPAMAAILYFAFAGVYGLLFSSIFAVYELSSIAYTFVATAGIFGALGIVGVTTKKDLTKFGPYLFVGLIGAIILTFINMFIFKSTMLNLAIDWAVLILFMGVTIYDINKIKKLVLSGTADPSRVHIYAAAMLFTDFLNIFIRLLSIFGDRR